MEAGGAVSALERRLWVGRWRSPVGVAAIFRQRAVVYARGHCLRLFNGQFARGTTRGCRPLRVDCLRRRCLRHVKSHRDPASPQLRLAFLVFPQLAGDDVTARAVRRHLDRGAPGRRRPHLGSLRRYAGNCRTVTVRFGTFCLRRRKWRSDVVWCDLIARLWRVQHGLIVGARLVQRASELDEFSIAILLHTDLSFDYTPRNWAWSAFLCPPGVVAATVAALQSVGVISFIVTVGNYRLVQQFQCRREQISISSINTTKHKLKLSCERYYTYRILY